MWLRLCKHDSVNLTVPVKSPNVFLWVWERFNKFFCSEPSGASLASRIQPSLDSLQNSHESVHTQWQWLLLGSIFLCAAGLNQHFHLRRHLSASALCLLKDLPTFFLLKRIVPCKYGLKTKLCHLSLLCCNGARFF